MHVATRAPRRPRRTIALAVAAAVVTGAAAGGGTAELLRDPGSGSSASTPVAAAATSSSSTAATATPATTTTADAATTDVAATVTRAGALTPAEIYTAASGSVVEITAQVTTQSQGGWNGGQSQQGTALGSGFVVDARGYVVTAAHVVSGATSVTLKVGSSDTAVAVTVVKVDEATDLAVLKVDAAAVAKVTPLALADSSKVATGDAVVAIGSPFALDGTLTAGVVSSLGRTLTSESNAQIHDAIQTDAAINEGNSGGPLLDDTGAVVGVNTQIATESGGNVGIGFAVPSNTVRALLAEAAPTASGTATTTTGATSTT